MSIPLPLTQTLRALGVPHLLDRPMAKHTYWRVGGPADVLVRVDSLNALAQLLQVAWAHQVPVHVVGNGSNMLVSDLGIRGMVVVLTGALASVAPVPGQDLPRIRCGAGLKLAALVARAQQNGWTELACFAGVPGTLGGAICMNAGTHLGQTADCVVQVEVLEPQRGRAVLPAAALRFGYRTAQLPPGAVITHAVLQTTTGCAADAKQRIQNHLKRRKSTQPLDKPSCGSTFRNPPGDYAGRLIEAAGLKGFRQGDAQISPLHANFIVNAGHARADDIRSIMEHIQRTVLEQFGVQLRPEVRLMGDWSHWKETHRYVQAPREQT